MDADYGEFEPVIGLEVHAQLLTRTKAFCGCATSFGDRPNTHTCPVCLGLPGALPVLNAEAVRMATRAALALGCTVQARSVFARKNYFYPDLPKGYQISQYELPLALSGKLELEVGETKRLARVHRVHMEEDAGKNIHGIGGDSIVDLNRAGTPLIEIVGEPDLRSGAEAGEYLRRLRDILVFIGVNDGNLEQGSFRCDANVSIRKVGDDALGTRTELKNINSFRFVEEAIDVEIRRQIALVDAGDRVRQQTRGYNHEKKESYLLRDKEGDAGYRYFPEPDLPPLEINEAYVEDVRRALPELPADKRRRFVSELGLSDYAAGVLTAHPEIASFFEMACKAGGAARDPVKVANFIQSEVLRDVTTRGLAAELPVTPEQVGELLASVDAGTISGKQAKEVYAGIRGTDVSPSAFIKERGMAVIRDEGALVAHAREVLAANPKQTAEYRGGKTALLGFFVGQVMKRTKGSASPQLVNDVLKRMLSEGDAPEAASATSAGISPSATSHVPPRSRRAGVGVERAATHLGELDLRVGRVVSATPVTSTELVELAVDVGEDAPRRIVASRSAGDATALEGRLVIVMCNVEPTEVTSGLMSDGKLLVAGDAGRTTWVAPSGDVPPGTRVR